MDSFKYLLTRYFFWFKDNAVREQLVRGRDYYVGASVVV